MVGGTRTIRRIRPTVPEAGKPCLRQAGVADLVSQGKGQFYEYPPLALRDLRGLLSLKRRLKKYEHATRVRIRNHLVSQYFPELDHFWGHSDGENLAIVKWCLDPSQIAGMEFEEFSCIR